MRARHFEHFLSLQGQLTQFRRRLRDESTRDPAHAEATATAVTEAKGWLAAAGKRRYKTAA